MTAPVSQELTPPPPPAGLGRAVAGAACSTWCVVFGVRFFATGDAAAACFALAFGCASAAFLCVGAE